MNNDALCLEIDHAKTSAKYPGETNIPARTVQLVDMKSNNHFSLKFIRAKRFGYFCRWTNESKTEKRKRWTY